MSLGKRNVLHTTCPSLNVIKTPHYTLSLFKLSGTNKLIPSAGITKWVLGKTACIFTCVCVTARCRWNCCIFLSLPVTACPQVSTASKASTPEQNCLPHNYEKEGVEKPLALSVTGTTSCGTADFHSQMMLSPWTVPLWSSHSSRVCLLRQSRAVCKEKAKMLHQKLALFFFRKTNPSHQDWIVLDTQSHCVGMEFAAALLHLSFQQ